MKNAFKKKKKNPSYLEGLLNRYVKEAKEEEKKDSKRVCAGYLSRLQDLASKVSETVAD